MNNKIPDLHSNHPQIMGIVNVTPDSFSDGGVYIETESAISHALKLWEEGANIIDIGGESTRPGAKKISVQEEQDRIIPVIEALNKEGVCMSVDTQNASTMQAAVAAGAGLINDISALTADEKSMSVVARCGVPICLMHMQGNPVTMQKNPEYDNVLLEVKSYLKSRIDTCRSAGISADKILVDPGIGFGKTLTHNLILLRDVSKLNDVCAGILVGTSRKSFIKDLSQNFYKIPEPHERLPGSLASVIYCLQQGVKFFRVHDVAATKQAFVVYEAIRQGQDPSRR